MKRDKNERCTDINNSPKRKSHSFTVGQWVYVRNRVRNKFDPLYCEDPWVIESVEKNGVTIHNAQLTKRKKRHVDDIKPYIVRGSDTHLVHKTPSQKNNNNTSFYTLPPQTVESTHLHTSASLPLDVGVAEDNRRNEELDGDAVRTSPGSSIAGRIIKIRHPSSPGHSVAERVKRRLCSKKKDT